MHIGAVYAACSPCALEQFVLTHQQLSANVVLRGSLLLRRHKEIVFSYSSHAYMQ